MIVYYFWFKIGKYWAWLSLIYQNSFLKGDKRIENKLYDKKVNL